MNIEDFLELGLKGDGSEVLEIYWHKPDRDSPDLMINRVVYVHDRVGHGVLLDPDHGDRGFLLCYYLELVRDVRAEYRDRNVKPPFIKVSLTRERNGCPRNSVQIPLNYIPRRPIILKPINPVA